VRLLISATLFLAPARPAAKLHTFLVAAAGGGGGDTAYLLEADTGGEIGSTTPLLLVLVNNYHISTKTSTSQLSARCNDKIQV
jgi:hypothetical protein